MANLSVAQRQTLEACKDWSAPFEIAYRRHEQTGVIVDLGGQRQILGRLRYLGMIKYGPPNDTYRITNLGRTALSSEGGDRA